VEANAMNKAERDAKLIRLYAMGDEYDTVTKALDAMRTLEPDRLYEVRDEPIVAMLRPMVEQADKVHRLMKVSDDALNAEIRRLEAMCFDEAGEPIDGSPDRETRMRESHQRCSAAWAAFDAYLRSQDHDVQSDEFMRLRGAYVDARGAHYTACHARQGTS
jgi:hypothetical protein